MCDAAGRIGEGSLAFVLDELLTVLAERLAPDQIAAACQAEINKALADRVFGPIVDAQASRACRPEQRDAQPERLPNVEQRPSVSSEPADALFTTAAEPVLPPGCRAERWDGLGAWVVLGRADGPSGVVASHRDMAKVAEMAWDRFGAFMSREDYEALVRERNRPSALRDAALVAPDRMIGETPEQYLARIQADMAAAHAYLDEAGIDLVPMGFQHALTARVQALGSMIGDAQAGEAYGREVAEQELDRVRSVLETAGEEETNVQAAERVVRQRDEYRAEVEYLRRVVSKEADRLRTEHAAALDILGGSSFDGLLERVKAAAAKAVGLRAECSLRAKAEAAARQEAEYAERRTEAHRAEISRLTDTIQRLRSEVVAAHESGRRQGHKEMGNG